MFMFKNRYGELRSGWSVAALLLLTIFGLGVGSSMVPEDGGEANITLKIAVTLVYCLITIGGAIFLFKMIYKRRLREMGLISKGWLPSGFHIAWNFFQGNIFGMNVSGNSQTSVFETKLGTNELLTGGNYGPEGGLLVTCVLLLGFLYMIFFLKKPSYPVWTMESDLPFTRREVLPAESR